MAQVLSKKLLEMLKERAKNANKPAIFTIDFPNNKSVKVKITEVGEDYIEVKEEGGAISIVPLTSGIAKLRDVTDSESHKWQGGE